MSQPEYAKEQPYPAQQQQPGGAYYNPGQPPMYSGQQPSQPTVVVVQNAPAPQSFVCHFVLSCFVIWCCGWIFGLVAFIIAIIANGKAATDPQSASKLGKASLAVSIIGIIVGVILLIIIIVRFLVFTQNVADAIASCKFIIDGECYKTKEPSLVSTCFNNGHYYENHCYYQ